MSVWPSAFALAEYPLRQVNTWSNEGWGTVFKENKELTQRINLTAYWMKSTFAQREVKNCVRLTATYLKLQLEAQKPKALIIGSILGGVVAYPYALAAASLTMVMDIVAGVAESFFRLCQGRAAEVPSILQKKIVASPVQHMTFLAVNLLASLVINAEIILQGREAAIPYKTISKYLWILPALVAPQFYGIGQETVARNLPKWARPDGFLIFIEGGAKNREGQGYTDPEEEFKTYYQNTYYHKTRRAGVDFEDPNEQKRRFRQQKAESHQKEIRLPSPMERAEQEWKIYLATLQISPSNVEPRDDFEKFKDLLAKGATLEQVYDLGLDEKSLQRKFKSYSLTIHPDRNAHRKEDAEKLFKAVTNARALLTELNGRNS
jgi:hypothetical protein